MKLAFVGKGGAGKSTIASLFVEYLSGNNQRVIAVDADVNMHLGTFLGVEYRQDLALSRDDNVRRIREYLRGTNPRIASTEHFVKTTPPGRGSHILYMRPEDEFFHKFGVALASGRFLYVGTYEPKDIGVGCYHGNLSILENILSHTVLHEGEWLVADMVAGVDAFANTLHAQFDAIVVVVEPTPESVAVLDQYRKLAQAARVDTRIYALGNKVVDREDDEYLQKAAGDRLVATIPFLASLRKARQRGNPVDLREIEGTRFQNMVTSLQKTQWSPQEKLFLLHGLHEKFANEDFIVRKLGNIHGQVDREFRFPEG